MRAFDWHRFLLEQRREHGKVLFSSAELANVAGSSPGVMNVQLVRLTKQGVVRQYARGLYGLPWGVGVESLVRAVDDGAYITGAYALHRHGLVTQVQHQIVCFTNRRTGRSRVRNTALGRLVLVCAGKRIYYPPADSVLASPEQALFDFVFLCRRDGADPRALVTLCGAGKLSPALLDDLGPRYPSTVRSDVADLVVETGLVAGSEAVTT
ncbi:MAG: hypothetical protein GF331_25160 [Chitinivibrionales bacterium]|nr:hypothetical protein [Chitinivibrionales bacterium]